MSSRRMAFKRVLDTLGGAETKAEGTGQELVLVLYCRVIAHLHA